MYHVLDDGQPLVLVGFVVCIDQRLETIQSIIFRLLWIMKILI